jgi:serine/threonine protein phosphatase PrpC
VLCCAVLCCALLCFALLCWPAGVTHLPEVQKIDLDAVFAHLQATAAGLSKVAADDPHSVAVAADSSSITTTASSSSSAAATTTGAATSPTMSPEEVAASTLCLVLATDGVWDNWLYQDVNKFVMDVTCLGAVAVAADGAKRVTISFMQRNALYAKRNFGSSADNATGIVLYISQDNRFPSL